MDTSKNIGAIRAQAGW